MTQSSYVTLLRKREMVADAASILRQQGYSDAGALVDAAAADHIDVAFDGYQMGVSRPRWHVIVYLTEPNLDIVGDNERCCSLANALHQVLRAFVKSFEEYVDKVLIRPLSTRPKLPNQATYHFPDGNRIPHRDLIFRSWPEVHAFGALMRLGATVVPLPAVRYGSSGFEPDFIVFYAGCVAVFEIDGPHHANETEAERAERLQPLTSHGVLVYRIPAPQCSTPSEAAEAVRPHLDDMAGRGPTIIDGEYTPLPPISN